MEARAFTRGCTIGKRGSRLPLLGTRVQPVGDRSYACAEYEYECALKPMYVIYYCIMLAVSTTRNAKLASNFFAIEAQQQSQSAWGQRR